VDKLLAFNHLQMGIHTKIFSVKDLAAESSQHWTYGRIFSFLAEYRPAYWDLHVAWLKEFPCGRSCRAMGGGRV
jgi:hypothetical protein